MPDDDERVPIEACTLPGEIKLTQSAMELAKRFQTVVPAGWIAAFSWHDGERVRAGKDAPWVDNGPGMHLGAYRIGQIPEEAIYNSGSLPYAVLIGKEIVESHPQNTIDLDESGRVILK